MATEAKNPTVDELEAKEEELFRTGPLSVLTTSVKSNSQARATTILYLPTPQGWTCCALASMQMAASLCLKAPAPSLVAVVQQDREACVVRFTAASACCSARQCPWRCARLPSGPGLRLLMPLGAWRAGAHQLPQQPEAAGPRKGV
jgi:hypothetical protein